MTDPKNRTAARVDNLKRLIDAFAGRELIRSDVDVILNFTPSASRNYLSELLGQGAIVVSRLIDTTTQARGIPAYVLNPDPAKVAAFLDQLGSAPIRDYRANGSRTNLDIALRDPTRRFHILTDDGGKLPTLRRAKPVRRDDLVAALFGGGEAPCAQTLDVAEAPRLAARISAFPEPAAIRFELEPA